MAPAIVPVPVERLEDFKELWRALYDHHNAVTPQLRDRARSFEASWRSRRELERGWLHCEPQSFALGALADSSYVGLAYVRVRTASGFASSWTFCDPLAELATLAVTPASRGQGIGSALMDAVEARLREIGIADMAIGVLATNADALRFYERRGALPYVTDLVQRVTPGP